MARREDGQRSNIGFMTFEIWRTSRGQQTDSICDTQWVRTDVLLLGRPGGTGCT